MSRSFSRLQLPRRSYTGRHPIQHDVHTRLQRRAVNQHARPANLPPIVHQIIQRPGQPLDKSTRADMDRRLEHKFTQAPARGILPKSISGIHKNSDPFEQEAEANAQQMNHQPPVGHTQPSGRFDNVRIHTSSAAAQSAQAINAQAYTIGNHIVFGRNQFAPQTLAGKQLLAHELTHVMQQQHRTATRPTIQRRVTDNYAEIEHRLTYRVFLDWVITDQEAREVLDILNRLSDQDLADTVTAMDRDGLVERLLDNVSTADEEQNAVLLGRINRYRSVSRTQQRIRDRLATGILDWFVTDDDAREVLRTLMGLDPQQLRTVVANMINSHSFDRFLDELPAEEHTRFAAFIERLRRIRDEFNLLVRTHTQYLRSRPGGAGRTVRRTVERTGYGGSRATWSDLSEQQQRAWRDRANRVISEVIASVRGTDLEQILSRSHLQFSPERAEQNNAYAYVTGGNTLHFGRSWIRNADANPQNVWQSIAHELGGHEEFGNTWSWEIMRATLARMTPEERREALGSANALYSAYGYLETEIYAELRELPYRVPGSGGDRPESTAQRPGDVHKQLTRIRQAFGQDVGRQIALRLYYRAVTDPRISDVSKRLLYTEIQSVFNMFPLVSPIQP